jgi:hypothetical protein
MDGGGALAHAGTRAQRPAARVRTTDLRCSMALKDKIMSKLTI